MGVLALHSTNLFIFCIERRTKLTTHVSEMIETSKGQSKKKNSSTLQSPVQGIIIVLILLFCVGLIGIYSRDAEITPIESINIKDYEALLARAKALTIKYKELSLSTGAPPASSDGAQQQLQIPAAQPNSAYLRSLNSPSQLTASKADLILGMAQDTDPKNLVR